MGNYISKLLEDEEDTTPIETEPIQLLPVAPKKKQRKNRTKRRRSEKVYEEEY
jgi:hypothetical protein